MLLLHLRTGVATIELPDNTTVRFHISPWVVPMDMAGYTLYKSHPERTYRLCAILPSESLVVKNTIYMTPSMAQHDVEEFKNTILKSFNKSPTNVPPT